MPEAFVRLKTHVMRTNLLAHASVFSEKKWRHTVFFSENIFFKLTRPKMLRKFHREATEQVRKKD